MTPQATESAPRSRRRGWWLPLALFAVLLGIYVPSATNGKVSNDINTNTLTAWNLAQTGKPWMENLDLPPTIKVPFYGPGADGHTVTYRSPGQIWAAVPFYLFSGSDQNTDFSIYPGGVAAALMTAAAMLLFFLALRRRVGDTTSLVAVGILALTTPMWSVSADALWTHPVTVLGIAGAAWAAERDRWWLAGVFLGFGIFGRLHVALIAAVLGLGIGWLRRDVRPVVKVGVPSLAAVGVLSVWAHFVYATWNPLAGYSEYGYTRYSTVVPGMGNLPFFTNLYGFFLAWDRGWLIWTPLLLVLLPAVVRGWRGAPDWTKVLALGGVVYLVAQVGINGYDGGATFWGYRLALEPLACVFPLYVVTFGHAGVTARRLLPWVTALQFAMILYGSVQTPLDVMNLTNNRWQPNSVFVALRDTPGVALPWLLASAGLWLAIWYALAARARHRAGTPTGVRGAGRT